MSLKKVVNLKSDFCPAESKEKKRNWSAFVQKRKLRLFKTTRLLKLFKVTLGNQEFIKKFFRFKKNARKSLLIKLRDFLQIRALKIWPIQILPTQIWPRWTLFSQKKSSYGFRHINLQSQVKGHYVFYLFTFIEADHSVITSFS